MLPYTHQFHTFHHHLIPSVAWLFWRGNGNCRWCAWFPRRPWHRRIRSLNSWELRSPVPGHDAWTILDPWWLLACPCHVGLLLSFEAWMSTHLRGGLCAWWATGTGRWSADSVEMDPGFFIDLKIHCAYNHMTLLEGRWTWERAGLIVRCQWGWRCANFLTVQHALYYNTQCSALRLDHMRQYTDLMACLVGSCQLWVSWLGS